MPSAFEEVLKEKKEFVWKEIEKYLSDLNFFPENPEIAEKYKDLLSFHREITSAYPERRGKYIRPTLLLLTAEAMGAQEKTALKTAAAMQTSEDWILIHDDFEDDSLQRRGAPALHRIYGKELAINAGDSLHVLMWKMLWDNTKVLGPKKAEEVACEFYQMLKRTTFGQTVEIKWTKENKTELENEDIFLILDGKTSYYTIAGPMRLGAIIGNADKNELKKLYFFGQLLGRCFQIKDDLLDLTSDFKGLKKQKGSDIIEGKRTLMLMHLLKAAKKKDKEKLKVILEKNKEEKTEKEVLKVIEMMESYGSLSYAQNIAENLAEEAKEYFDNELLFLENNPARKNLRLAVDFVLHRDY